MAVICSFEFQTHLVYLVDAGDLFSRTLDNDHLHGAVQ